MKRAFLRLAIVSSMAFCAPVSLPAWADDAAVKIEDSKNEAAIKQEAAAKAATLPKPAVSLSAFDKIEVRRLDLSDAVKRDQRKVDKSERLQSRLDLRLQDTVAHWNGNGADGPRTLIVTPRLTGLHIVSTGARIFAFAFAGQSSITLTLELTDASTGKVIADPQINMGSGSFSGAFSFGTTDNNLINYMAETVNQYLVANKGAAATAAGTGDATATASRP